MMHLRLLILILSAASLFQAGSAQNLCDITWSAPVRVSSDSAFSTLPAIGEGNGRIHLLWFGLDGSPTLSLSSSGIQYAHSVNGGMSFDPPVVLLPYLNTLSPGGFMAVDGDRVFVTASATIDTSTGIVLFESTDGGLTWSGPRYVDRNPGYLASNITALGQVVFIGFRDSETNQDGMFRSVDGGATWGPPIPTGRSFYDIAESSGRLHAVGPYAGAGQTEVGYSFSADTGARWFGFMSLSPEDQIRSLAGRITVSPGGYLHAAWIDTGWVIARSSLNNGVSWTGWNVLSEEGGNVTVDVGSDNEFVFVVWDRDVSNTGGLRARLSNDFGEIYCPVITPAGSLLAGEPVVLVSDSTVHLAWIDDEGGTPEIYYRNGALMRNPAIAERPPVEFLLKQSYPNPANGTVRIDFHVPVATEVVIGLWSAIGQHVATLGRRAYDPGRYTLSVDVGELPSGAYFYRFSSAHFVSTGKMMILR